MSSTNVLKAKESVVAHDVLRSPLMPSPGEKVTIADVARAAGVSTTAVSYAINGKGRIPEATRQIVLETAKQLGYEANYYAQRIKGGCSKTIAFFSADIAGVAGEKVTRIQQELVQRGFSAPLHGLGHASVNEHVEAIKQLRRQRPRAIVCGGGLHESALDELRRFRQEDGIVVCYDDSFPSDFEQVNLDRELGAYNATRHLLAESHRDIGISSHHHNPIETAYTRGFKRALHDIGAPFREEWYCPFYPFESAGKDLASRFIAMLERPTAFYIVDDRAATAFVNYALRAGLKIPQDVSIVTHDPAGVAEHCVVPLTTVSHPVSEVVASVVSLLISRLDGHDGPPRHVVVGGQLVKRSSVRKLEP